MLRMHSKQNNMNELEVKRFEPYKNLIIRIFKMEYDGESFMTDFYDLN
jgi:hypothetical protein